MAPRLWDPEFGIQNLGDHRMQSGGLSSWFAGETVCPVDLTLSNGCILTDAFRCKLHKLRKAIKLMKFWWSFIVFGHQPVDSCRIWNSLHEIVMKLIKRRLVGGTKPSVSWLLATCMRSQSRNAISPKSSPPKRYPLKDEFFYQRLKRV